MRFTKNRDLTLEQVGEAGPIWCAEDADGRETMLQFIPANAEVFEQWQPNGAELSVESTPSGLVVRYPKHRLEPSNTSRAMVSGSDGGYLDLPQTQAIPLKVKRRPGAAARLLMTIVVAVGTAAGFLLWGALPGLQTEPVDCEVSLQQELNDFFTLRAQKLMAEDLDSLVEIEVERVLAQDQTVISQMLREGISVQGLHFIVQMQRVVQCPSSAGRLSGAKVEALVTQRQEAVCKGFDCTESEGETLRALFLEFDEAGRLRVVKDLGA